MLTNRADMILVTGSIAYDQIMDFPGRFSDHIHPEKIHILNVSFLVSSMRKSFGGTAGNIAYTLSLLGMDCAVMGFVGEDFAPYKTFLTKSGVDTSLIKEVFGYHTSSAFGITDKHDNQIWGFYSGADESSNNLSVSRVRLPIHFGVVAPHNPQAMLRFSREYNKKKIPYLFDPGMQLPWLSSDDLKTACMGATIIIGNDYEVSVIEKKMGIDNLHTHFPDKIVITTMGIQGSRVSRAKKTEMIKTALVKDASDPTGAGDAYRAGFLAGYLRRLNLKTCAQMGSVAAAYTVERYGTTTHRFTISEFTRRYQENYKKKLNL